ncbi:hypothetical protein GWK47_019387 [Chionoecetes opilio]|uniref:BZIP domain-containing protein n=1 Tax=Chionoecetes opilio TaxID=41210 RepID=A0A8J4XSE7_CHIOP|nr:hypothetical protein GWK47_019387 [Chionoecetes opilio]
MYYTDDTAMYMDILPFDDNKPQLVESTKLPLPEPLDPWLVDQAEFSDIRFPATNTPSSSTLFGRLSPSMEEFANSLLPNEVNLPLIDEAFDVDVALDSLKNDDSLGDAFGSLALETPNQHQHHQQHPAEATSRRRSKRLSSKATCMASYDEPAEPHTFAGQGLPPYPGQDFSLPVDQCPVYDASGDVSDEGARVRRKRRPRVSYSTLTEDQKYHRIRDLNNEASRLYRERTRGQLTGLQGQESIEVERNRVLRAKEEGLERLRDEIKAFTFNFFREHVGSNGVQ